MKTVLWKENFKAPQAWHNSIAVFFSAGSTGRAFLAGLN